MFLMMCKGNVLLQMLLLPLNVLLLFLKCVCALVVVLLRLHGGYIKWQMSQRKASANSHLGTIQRYTLLIDWSGYKLDHLQKD